MRNNLKNVFVVIAGILLFLSCKNGGKYYQTVISDEWKFMTGDSMQWTVPEYDDSHWDIISTKNDWESQGYEEYDGYAWYRKSFSVPKASKELIVKSGGLIVSYDRADDVDEVFFNGELIGKTGEFPPRYRGMFDAKRKYHIPAALIRFDEENIIAIRVFDESGSGGILTEKFKLNTLSPMDSLTFHVESEDEDWIFINPQQVELNVRLEKNIEKNTAFRLVCKITTDDFLPVDSLLFKVKTDGTGNINQQIKFQPPAPGFYRFTIYAEKDGIQSEPKKFNVGFEPEKILSPRDAKNDFDEFWTKTRAELDKVAPRYKLTLLKEKSSDIKNMYHVEMYSFGNVKIEGYYSVPKKEGKYPVIIAYMGYGSNPYFPDANALPDFCEFVLSVRGQGIQKSTNIYGDWLVYGLKRKETYYYRGAYMDLIRAVDFVASRPEVDAEKIVTEGGSQGGAFTMAVCALDKRIKAGAPHITFLSDFRDYFRICPWPGSAFENYLRKNPEESWENVYDVLSYFDINNLATHISCPIVMGVGLQDETCPPHTNFAGYNQVKSEKNYYVYREQKHGVGKSWWKTREDFFRKVLETDNQ